MKNLGAIGFVWVGCTVAWMILGSALALRSGDTLESNSAAVESLWGPEAVQVHPQATLAPSDPAAQLAGVGWSGDTYGREVAQPAITPPDAVRLAGSQISVELDLEHRQKGLLWLPTYAASFVGVYEWRYDRPERNTVHFEFPLNSAGESFDGFSITREGEPVRAETRNGIARWSADVDGATTLRYRVTYRTRGLKSWTYRPTDGTGEVENFRLAMSVNDADVDFAPESLSPTTHGSMGDGWNGEWRFDHLISADPIKVVLPQLLNPGPLAGKITFFAPVSLLFFFFVVALVAKARFRDLHPMHFFFLGCSFFSFHLLFAYMVDHVPVLPSFAAASVTSLFLTISYARHFTGMRFALRVMGGAQFVYLVLFSASFFLDGFTGLAVTLGAIATLFVMMQLTGRTTWGTGSPDVEDEVNRAMQPQAVQPQPPVDGAPQSF